MKSAPTIVLELRPSRALRLALAAVAALALLAIALAGTPTAITLLLAVIAAAIALRADAQLRGPRGTRLVLDPTGDWKVETAEGSLPAMELTHSAEVGPLVALTLGRGGTARRIVLLPDSCDREDLRRLRVWLRHGHPDARKALAIQ